MFTLMDWIAFGIVIVCMASVLAYMQFGMFLPAKKKTRIITLLVELALLIALIGGCGIYRTHTESGKRGLKSWQSETSGGINRTVTVYDIKGEEIAKYTGRFDVEESSQEGVVKIKFDCNGKRHIIYAQTGTVLIDEN